MDDAWIWNGKTYRWYLDPSVSWDGKRFRIGGRFETLHEAKQRILASIAATALTRLPKGGTNARVYATKSGDILQEISNNEWTKEELEAQYALLSFYDDRVPSVISHDPESDLQTLGEWETDQEREPWYRWGGEQFIISYYAVLDRYVSKGQQYRGFTLENEMRPLLSYAYSELSYRISELDTSESPLHTIGMFLAFVENPRK